MTCPSCGAPNEGTRKFCGECGRGLAVACASCGTPNAPGTKFCGECGSGLALVDSETRTAEGNGVTDGETVAVLARSASERRLVSVMFADLVGFTTLAESRDAARTRRTRRPCRSSGRRSRSTSPTPMSDGSSNPALPSCWASRREARATRRTCSAHGASSSSAWPTRLRRSSSSRTCIGPMTPCSTSSSTSSTGPATGRSSSSRPRVPSSSSGDRRGGRRSAASPRFTSNPSRLPSWSSCSRAR